MSKKFEVEILEVKGSCDNELFKKMCEKRDLVAIKLQDILNQEIAISGYAEVKIKTDEKEFTLYYIDTYEYGLFSTGSEYFMKSLKDYMEDVNTFRIVEVKTKKGKTYKCVPQLKKGDSNG